MSSPMRSEAQALHTRQHLRRSGSSGSGLDKHVSGLTSTLLARLLLLSGCIAAVMLCGALFVPAKVPRTSMRMRGLYEDPGGSILPKVRAGTLVIYVFSKTDLEYERNLRFFIQHGMWEGDGCDYAIIVQQDDKLFGPPELPELPANARYIFHENRCYDWGTIGWALETGKVDASLYRYIIFMNSSVRGPFLPNYFPKRLHWSKVFTARLSEDVKLVGSTISCEPAYLRGNPSNEARHTAHVQSYVIATDQVGIRVLQEDGRVLACYEDMSDTIFHAEVGASAAILQQGYTIDSLMLRYQGTDWRNQSNWDCNAGLNPYAEFAYDGLLLNPLEVLFVKVKAFQMQTDWMSALMARTYDRWLSQDGDGSVNSNIYRDRKSSFRLSKAITMMIRGPACFDFDLYRSKSADLAGLTDNDMLWEHFVRDGQFEGRVFRFTCANPLQDNSISETLLLEAKTMVAQLMARAFPGGLPQAAVSLSSTDAF